MTTEKTYTAQDAYDMGAFREDALTKEEAMEAYCDDEENGDQD